MIPRVESPLCRLDARTTSIRFTEAMIGLESISSFALGKERSAGKPDNIMTTGRQTPVDDDQSSARQTQFLITAFLCLTDATLVGSSTHDFTVRTDPIMRRLGKARTPWARGVMLPLGARLSNGTSGFFLGAGGGRDDPDMEPFEFSKTGVLRRRC